MRFAQIQGNEAVLKALSGMVDSGKVPHALLFHENDGGGGVAIALAFLQYLYCRRRHDGDSCGECPSCNKVSKLIHPDIHFIFPVVLPAGSSQSDFSPCEAFIPQWRSLLLENPGFTENDLFEALGFEGKKPVIGAAEAGNLLRRVLTLSSLEGGYTAVMVYLPETMNDTAANKLLKMLEEPPAQTVFVLVTHSPERLLPTILSRCQLVRIQSESAPKAISFDDSGMLSSLMEALLSRNLSDALDTAEQLAALPSRENAKAFCKFAAERFRAVFLWQQGLGETLAPEDAEAAAWAGKVRRTFPRKALEITDRTMRRIERNVNLKILFTDLVDRLYLNV
ncbi:MAG: hypothetical protein K6C31_02920 [Bacteroidales bacterium]|nr:hypothetical protein [Bacteroidales bacterium]